MLRRLLVVSLLLLRLSEARLLWLVLRLGEVRLLRLLLEVRLSDRLLSHAIHAHGVRGPLLLLLSLLLHDVEFLDHSARVVGVFLLDLGDVVGMGSHELL